MNRAIARTPLIIVTIVGAVVAALLGSVGIASAGPVSHPAVVQKDPVNWTPHIKPDGGKRPQAFAVEQLGDTMYVGGRFGAAENANRTVTYERHNIMAFDATNGQMRSFAPNISGDVWALEASSDAIYVGGKFKTVDGVSRPTIAKLDPVTGAVDPNFNPAIKGARITEIQLVNGRLIVGGSFGTKLRALNPNTGKNTKYIDINVTGKLPGSNGNVDVFKFAVNPAGTRLVAVGNFMQVNGQTRSRAFMLDLGASDVTLSSWYYQPLTNNCRATTPSRIAYVKDVDFSPDGSYFAIVSTGFIPQSGGLFRDVCDAAARFETDTLNPNRPTWINYTGGDTLHGVIATGAAVYVQGHSRYLDNPYGVDSAGPGSVWRPGGGSINPTTGMANDWNPKQFNATGGYNYLATDAGLWIVRDGKYFNNEFHFGIVFCPLP